MDIVTDAVKLLGTPMGPDSGRITAMALDTVTKHNPFFEALADPEMPRPVAGRLLRLSGVPRLNFLTRVGYQGEYQAALRRFDRNVVGTAASLFIDEPEDLDPKLKEQATKPLKHAGLGLTRMEEIAPFAWWGAMANAAYHLRRLFPDALPDRLNNELGA